MHKQSIPGRLSPPMWPGYEANERLGEIFAITSCSHEERYQALALPLYHTTSDGKLVRGLGRLKTSQLQCNMKTHTMKVVV